RPHHRGTCRFPGCRRSAHRSDLDHTLAYPHGPTAENNLSALCRHHHRIKTVTRWRPEHLPGAVICWTSPTGHTHDPERPSDAA
ncbi:MAG: HNH endonuclease, partial [Geodermatophilaceae bacterium]|nr:HNH endonuclease [Geodermatophilaceae bacterium]